MEKRVYTYDARRYFFDVKVPAYVSVLGLLVSAVMFATGFLLVVAVLLAVICAYTVFNTFVAHAYPRVVVLDDAALSFESFGRTDSYSLAELKRVSVRENGSPLREYVRVNDSSVMGGRYFLVCGDMYDAEGEKASYLYDYLLECEARLDPENIRVKARRMNERRAARSEASEKRPKR